MWKILNMAPSPEPGELPPVNRAGRQGPQGGMPGAPRIDENLEPMSGIIPKDRFREADRERQKVQITPQQYAGIAPAVPDPAQREFRAPGFGGVVMTDAAARVVAQRMVEMEERIRELEGSAAQQRAVEGRLGALERRLRGAEAGTQVSRSAVDDEVRRLEARVMELTSEVIRARQEANDIKIRYDGAVREVQDAKASVRDLSTQVGQLAQVSSNAMKGSQEISRQRFVTIESTYRELQTQIERQKATMDAMRAEYLDNLTKVSSRVDNGEGAIDRLRSVETEAVQATAQQLSQVRGEMARVEAALDGHRKATASALDVMRVELEKASARLATEEARSDASVRAALGQALSNTDNKVTRVERAVAELAGRVRNNHREVLGEMATKVEAMARALALDRKEAAERIAAVERRVAEGITLVHRVEDDLTKRADRGTRDQLRMIQELRTLIEATDHKHGRQIEQVVALARSLVGDLEESQERRRRQVEDIVRMEIQARVRADDQVKQATARGLREVKAAVGQQLELAMRDVKDRIEGVRQQVDGVAADHMLEESLVRVECTEQIQAAESRLRVALAEGVRGAEQRMEAMASTRLAEGVTSGDKLALELDSVRAALESLRGLSDSRLSTVEGRLERLHDELNKAVERAAAESRAALEQERSVREQGDHDLRMELVRGDADALAKMEMHRAEQRATAERHARATAEHFKKTAREQAESVAKLAGALEASQRSVEGSVQVLELDVSRLRGQLDAVSSDVTRTRGALFEAVEEAMGRHARSFGDAAPVADVVRLAAEVRGVCDTLEQHMAQRLAAVEVQMAEVDRRARDLAAGMASHPTDFVAASGPIRSPGGESGIPLSQTMPRASGPGPFGSPEALAEGADCGLASTDVKESGVSPTDPISEAIREIRSGAAHAEANYMETQRRLAMEEDMALQQLRSTGRTQDRKEDGEEKGDARARVLGREEDGAEWEQDNEVETSGAAVATHRDPSEGGLASEEQEEERGQGPVVLSMHATKGGRVTLSLSARDGAAGEAGVERRDESTSERESGAVEASMEAPIDGSEGEERREEVRETEGDGPAVDEEEYGRSGDLRESDIAGIDDVVDELVAIAGAGSSFDAGVNLGEGIKESLRGADEKLHEEGETMNEGERQDREEGREDAGLGNAGGKENEEEEERDEYDDELPAGGDGDGDGELVEELGDTLGGSGAVEELDESNVVDAAQDEVGGVGTGGEAGGDADERDSDAGEVMVEGVDSEADLNDAEMATDEQIDVADELGDPEAVAEGLDEGKGGGGNESRKEPLDEQGHEEEGGKGEGMQAVGHEGENVEVATEGGVDSEGEGKEDEVEEDEEYQDEEFERAAPEELGDAPEELGGETPEGGTSAVEEAADVEDVADEVEADDMGDSRGQEMAESTGVEQVEEGTNGQPEASSGVAEGDEDGDDGKGGAEEHKSAVPGAAAGAPSEVDAAEELDDL